MISNNTPTQDQILELVNSHIASDNRLFIVWYGSIRSGKTYGACQAILKHASERSGALYILGAYTQRQVWVNLAPILKELAEAMELDYSEHKSPSNPHIVIGDNVFLVTGGKDGQRSKAIQGITASGLLLDELPNLDRDFIEECESRTSARGAFRIYTANKGNPYHWTTRYYYERLRTQDIKGYLFESLTSENSHVDADFVAERRSEFDSRTALAKLDNEFVAPNPIYNARVLEDDSPQGTEIVAIGTDGREYVELGLSPIKQGEWLITEQGRGECPVTDIADKLPVILPDTLQLLARQLRRDRRRVKVYQTTPQRWRTETTQTILSQHCYVHSDAHGLLDTLHEYSSPMTRDDKYIPALDALAQHIRRLI